MTLENIKKLYKHFCTLAEGDFNERTFDFELPKSKLPQGVEDEDGGTMHVGRMPQKRIDLIRSDAKRHKEDMEAKYPQLLAKKEKVSVPQKPVQTKKVKKDAGKDSL